jgi:MFS family permease
MVTRLAIPFAAIGLLDASAADLAWLTAAGLLPGVLVGLFAGTWADRRRKRPLLIASDLGRAILYLSIPAAALAGMLSLGHLYAVAFLAGCLRTLFDVAHISYLPALVAKGQLVAANSRLRAAEAVTEGAAFGAAGWLVQLLSAPLAVALDSLSFLVSAGLLAGIRGREPVPRAPEARGGARDALTETWEGLRFVLAHPVLRRLLVSGVALAISYGLFSVVFLLFVHAELGFPEGGLGMVFAVGAASSFFGAFAAERATRRWGVKRTICAGLMLYAASTALIPLIPAFGLLGWLLMIGHQLGDGGEVAYAVNHVSLVQATAPAELLGRVTGAFEFAGVGAMLLGTALGGLLGDTLGPRGTLALASAFAWLAALWLLRMPRTARAA